MNFNYFLKLILTKNCCAVSKFRPAAGHPTPWAVKGLLRAIRVPPRRNNFSGYQTRISWSTAQPATSTSSIAGYFLLMWQNHTARQRVKWVITSDYTLAAHPDHKISLASLDDL